MSPARRFRPSSGGALLALGLLAGSALAQYQPSTISPSPYARPSAYENERPAAPPPGTGHGMTAPINVTVNTPTLSTAPPPPAASSAMPFMPMPMPMPMPMGGWGHGYGGWGGGLAGAGPGIGYGAALEGMASLQRAQGQYWQDIQQAKMGREQALQANLDTARKRVEYEMWYESMKDNAIKSRDRERATDLDWARKDPPKTEIWSGRTLNVLLRSVLQSSAPTRGPHISLDPETLRGLNLTDGTTRGTLALAKDEGKIAWTEAFDDPAFDEPRDRFSKNFSQAMNAAARGEAPDRTAVRQLRDDLTLLSNRLVDRASDLAPSEFIQGRRLINQLQDNVKGLSDARLVRSSQNNWRSSVRTVADLVDHLMRNGLQFGPAASSSDDPAYTAAYFAMRAYERELVQHGLASR